jgi:hypothetical protein
VIAGPNQTSSFPFETYFASVFVVVFVRRYFFVERRSVFSGNFAFIVDIVNTGIVAPSYGSNWPFESIFVYENRDIVFLVRKRYVDRSSASDDRGYRGSVSGDYGLHVVSREIETISDVFVVANVNAERSFGRSKNVRHDTTDVKLRFYDFTVRSRGRKRCDRRRTAGNDFSVDDVTASGKLVVRTVDDVTGAANFVPVSVYNVTRSRNDVKISDDKVTRSGYTQSITFYRFPLSVVRHFRALRVRTKKR